MNYVIFLALSVLFIYFIIKIICIKQKKALIKRGDSIIALFKSCEASGRMRTNNTCNFKTEDNDTIWFMSSSNDVRVWSIYIEGSQETDAELMTYITSALLNIKANIQRKTNDKKSTIIKNN